MSASSQNIQLSYFYRDAGNYKLFGRVVFRNPENLSIEEVRCRIETQLIDGAFFEAQRWGLPELQFENYLPELDHNCCEFESVDATSLNISEEQTIGSFLHTIENL